MKGRKWSAEEKLAIVLEGIKGAKLVVEICREHLPVGRQVRLRRPSTINGGPTATLAWEYDEAGRPLTQVLPGGERLHYATPTTGPEEPPPSPSTASPC